MPAQLLRLPPSAYVPTRDRPLSPCSKHATEHIIRNYAEQSKGWWGTFIEVWEAFMGEAQWIGADLAA